MSAIDRFKELLDERGWTYVPVYRTSGMQVDQQVELQVFGQRMVVTKAHPINDPTHTRLVAHIMCPLPEQLMMMLGCMCGREDDGVERTNNGVDVTTCVPDDYTAKLMAEVERLQDENAELVRVLHEVEREAVHAYKCLQKDCEITTGSASHYFAKWWHAECQNDRLKVENDRLRELVRDIWRFTGAACKKYPRLFDPSAPGGQMVRLNPINAFEQRMAELGIEVDE